MLKYRLKNDCALYLPFLISLLIYLLYVLLNSHRHRRGVWSWGGYIQYQAGFKQCFVRGGAKRGQAGVVLLKIGEVFI